jgi:serine/threonine-protein kinase
MRQQQPPMTVFELLTVMMDVARAMAAAHRAGIVHRDLKPTNIHIHKDRSGVAVPKVLDFGVSKFLMENERDQSLTVAGTVLGSPLYMSPEQARGQLDTDHRTDVYAFGAILFEALCVYGCYDAPNFNALIVAIATTEPRSIDQCAPQMPESLRALVRDCLATDKAKRLDSFDAVIARLTPVLAELRQNPVRLPTPARRPDEAPRNPESTSAMPAIIRPGEIDSVPPPPENAPSAAPWSGTVGGYRPNQKPPIMLFLATGAVFGLILIAAAIVLVFVTHRRPRPSEPVAAKTDSTASEVIELPSTAPSSSEVPVVSIDDLPSKGAKMRLGRLSVDAAPLACTIAVDGHVRGTTPMMGMDVPPGSHVVRCETTSGLAKMATVSVVEGQTAHAHFSTNP